MHSLVQLVTSATHVAWSVAERCMESCMEYAQLVHVVPVY